MRKAIFREDLAMQTEEEHPAHKSPEYSLVGATKMERCSDKAF